MAYYSELFGVRHVQMVLMFWGLALAYAMRVNMSMAVVAMTGPGGDSKFDWSMQTQSVMMSSFFWGYIVLQVPAGELAHRVGGKALLAAAVALNSALVLLIPKCAYYGGWQLICFCRVLQGLAQGVIFPSIHNLLGKWVPVEEKSRLGQFAYAGPQLGTALQLITAGYIADRWGWPMIFYSVGFLGVLWTIVYVYLGAASPQDSEYISAEERNYIHSSTGTGDGHQILKTPWRSILTSKPFLALTLAHCGQNWGFWTLLAEIPSYLKLVLGVDIRSNGVLSALPYLSMYLLSFVFAITLDHCLRRQWLSLSASRKLSNSIGFYGAAAALIGLSCVSTNVAGAVTLLVAAVGINAGHITGLVLVHIDMAPNYAGTLMGITNFAANVVSIIAPLVAGAILKDETDPKEWRVVFFLAAAVYVATNTAYVACGTSDRQPWDQPGECSVLIDGDSTKKRQSAAVEK